MLDYGLAPEGMGSWGATIAQLADFYGVDASLISGDAAIRHLSTNGTASP